MKNTSKIFAILLMALTLTIFPLTARAADEAKPAGDAKPATEVKAPEAKAPEAKPEDDKVTGEVDLAVLSAYIWRGQELSRHSAVIQPAATVNYKGFSLNIWGNLDTRPYAAGTEKYGANFTETDLTLSYTHKIGIVSLTGGYIYYALAAPYAGGTDPLDSQELFVTVALDTLLSPTLSVYKEIDHYHQWYALLGASHTFQLHEKVGLKLAGQVSYLLSQDETTYAKYDSNSVATNEKFSNFHDGTLSVSLPVAVTKSLTVAPIVTYVFPLSNDAKYEMRARGLQGASSPSDRDCTYLYGGVTVSFTF